MVRNQLFLFIMQELERALIIREEALHQEQGDGERQDLLRGAGKPEDARVGGAHGRHPADAQLGAQTDKHVAPAVGDHPREEKTDEKAGISDRAEDRFADLFEFLLHLPSFGERRAGVDERRIPVDGDLI